MSTNYHSSANYGSNANYGSHANYYSDANYCSHANYKGKALYSCIFTYQEVAKAFMIFKTQSTEERVNEVSREFWRACGDWKPRHTDIHKLYNESGEEWTEVDASKQTVKGGYQDAWSDIPKKALDYITSIPEFDAEIFKKITGIDVNSDKVKITCEGKTVEISRESAKALNLI